MIQKQSEDVDEIIEDMEHRVGRDQEIRLMKIHYKTEKKWMLIFWTRRDQDKAVWFFYVREEI